MRVIAGTKKRLQLQTVPGLQTRPTTDRIKETLFNMLGNDVYDCRFLDLFAGSGQMGIEALSRGARCSYFIEKDKKALNCIRHNLEHTQLIDQATILPGDVTTCLKGLAGQESFDIIFMDPPYQLGLEQKVLEAIETHKILSQEGYIVVEAALDTDFSFVQDIPFTIIKEKIYKTNKHLFIALQ